jgi:Xaa-Pro dipeptidase
MTISRRNLLKSGAALPLAAGLGSALSAWPAAAPAAVPQAQQPREVPEAFRALKPLGDRVKPITVPEFQGRIAHAQKLMADLKPGFQALYISPGTSLYYFTGIRWGLSERVVALTIPRTGDPLLISPGFEEGRLRELMRWPIELRVWQEDENPGELVAKWLTERGIRTGIMGIEETTRYTYYDKLRKAAPGLEFPSGDPITIGCRGQKSDHELELMRLACEATCDVYKAVFASIREGMTQRDINGLYSMGLQRMGLGGGGGLVLLGKWAALPHGTTQPQQLKEGEPILIDAGTSVESYASDVTRTGVLGKPSDKLQKAFDTLHKSQEAALEAARRGRLSGAVDDAARAVVTAAGYGPGYKYFAHRLGHGIGLDGHEHPYLVRGSKTVLEPGMTFSNEPGIYVVDDFGIRLEDDMVIAADGPAQLLTPRLQHSLENPMG